MNSRANILDDVDEDTSIQVTVIRQGKNTQQNNSEDKEWQEEVNQSIEIRSMTEEEKKEAERAKKEAKKKETLNSSTKVESEAEDDLDYWPEDWEDEEEEWED